MSICRYSVIEDGTLSVDLPSGDGMNAIIGYPEQEGLGRYDFQTIISENSAGCQGIALSLLLIYAGEAGSHVRLSRNGTKPFRTGFLQICGVFQVPTGPQSLFPDIYYPGFEPTILWRSDAQDPVDFRAVDLLFCPWSWSSE
jgi:hypothetical protein